MAWTPSEWNLLFRQLDATRGDNKYFVMVYCGAWQLSDTMRSLKGHGYVDIQVLYWYKFNQNTEGTDNFVYAFELIVIAFRNSRKDVKWYLPKNPLLRHNMIHGPSLRKFHTLSGGKPINKTQKPPYVTYLICKAFLDPGSNILVVGSGSGGDVEGAVAAHMNTFAIEKDKKQFDAVVPIWQSYATSLESVSLDTLFKDVAEGTIGFPAIYQELTPSNVEHLREVAAGLREEARRPQLSQGSKSLTCSGCSEEVEKGMDLHICEECHKENCGTCISKMRQHKDYPGCNVILCNVVCMQAYNESLDGPESALQTPEVSSSVVSTPQSDTSGQSKK